MPRKLSLHTLCALVAFVATISVVATPILSSADSNPNSTPIPLAVLQTPIVQVRASLEPSEGPPRQGIDVSPGGGQELSGDGYMAGVPSHLKGTWRLQPSGTDRWLWPVQWVDQKLARAAGAGGLVLETADAGLHWMTTPQQAATGVDIHDMVFVDRYYGWIVGWNYVGKTTDGGTTWQQQDYGANHNLLGAHFLDRQRGWIVGQSWIRRTTNGGSTWQATQMPAPQTNLQDVFFVDQNVGWVVGWGGNILKSTDGGATWTRQQSGTSVILEGVFFADTAHGVVVGHGGTILTTSNGGATWEERGSIVGNDLYGVDFLDAAVGWTCGTNGTMLVTSDGGLTWSGEITGVDVTLQKISVLDANHVLAAGNGGVILRRTLDLTASVKRATHPPSLDGWLSEWSHIAGFDLGKNKAETIDREIPSSSDMFINLKAAWSSDNLYVAGSVVDDVLIGNDGDPAKPWLSDSIEIGLESFAGTHQFTFAIDGRQADQGVPIHSSSFYTQTTASGWSFEAAIPVSALGLSTFQVGQRVKFTFGVWDDDVRGGTAGQSHMIRRGTSTFAAAASVTGWGELRLESEVVPFPTYTPTPTATSTHTPTPTPTFTSTPTATPTIPTTGSISGVVWNDVNGNGKRESGEQGIFGVEVILYSGVTVRGLTRTGVDGAYSMPSIEPGLYDVVHVPPLGLRSSTPGKVNVSVEAGDVITVDFGDWIGNFTWLPLLMR